MHEIKIPIVRWENVYQKEVQQKFVAWPKVVAALTKIQLADTKESVSLFSTVEFEPGATRKSELVKSIGALVLDFDDGDDPAEVQDYFRTYEHIAYSTFRNTADHPRFRIVMPFSEPVSPVKFRSVWAAIRDHMPFRIDEHCKDFSRMFYLPSARHDNNDAFANYNSGELFDPNSIQSSEPIPTKTAKPVQSKTKTDDEAVAADAITFISPDCDYEQWIHIGMALKAGIGEHAYQIWDSWSSGSSKYPGEKTLRKHWKSFSGSAIQLGTLLKTAQENGWQYPKTSSAPPVPPPPPMPEYGPADHQSYAVADPIPDNLFGGDPLDIFGTFKPRPLPLDAFPEAFREYIQDQAELLGSDPSYIGMAALAASAACIDDSIRLQPKRHDPTWTESARIWVALVGDPSSKKSPAISKAIRHLKRFDREMAQQSAAERIRYEEQLDDYKQIKQQARKSGNPMPEAPERPKSKRMLVSDATVEALGVVLQDNPQGVLCLQDELTGWFAGMDAYKGGSKGASKDRANWLEAYNGGPRLIDRVIRGDIFVPNWSVSMLGGIQPDMLRRVASNLGHDGLLQRFMIVVGGEPEQEHDRTPNFEASDRFRLLFEWLRQLQPSNDTVRMDEAAHQARERVSAAARRMSRVMDSQHLRSWLGKWDGLFARLTLLYHVIECGDRGIHPAHINVSGATAEMVERLITVHLFRHAVHFFSDVLDANDRHEDGRRLAKAILAKKLNRITRRDALHACKSIRRLAAWEFREVIGTLEFAAWLAPDADKIGVDGKPNAWWVNPEIHKQFQQIGADELARRMSGRAEIEARLND